MSILDDDDDIVPACGLTAQPISRRKQALNSPIQAQFNHSSGVHSQASGGLLLIALVRPRQAVKPLHAALHSLIVRGPDDGWKWFYVKKGVKHLITDAQWGERPLTVNVCVADQGFQHVSCAKSLPPCHYSPNTGIRRGQHGSGRRISATCPDWAAECAILQNNSFFIFLYSLWARWVTAESHAGRVSVETKKWTQSAIDDCSPLWIPVLFHERSLGDATKMCSFLSFLPCNKTRWDTVVLIIFLQETIMCHSSNGNK